MEQQLVMRVPLSNLTPEDFVPTAEEAQRSHELRQILCFCAEAIDDLFEKAVRAVREFANNPRLMRAAGWDSVDEMLLDPDVQGALKISVGSYEQRRRLLRLAEVDRVLPSIEVLRTGRLSSLTVTSRLPRLEKLLKEKIPQEEMESRARAIIHDDVPEVDEDEEPLIEFSGNHILRNGKRVIRVTDGGVRGARLVSVLSHLQINWRMEGAEIVAYDRKGARQVIGKWLVDDDQVRAWGARRLHAGRALNK